MPRISVILPTHNRAHLLAESIESVLSQTFVDFELIVVDDDSMDETEKVVSSFTDPRLRYVRQANTGCPGARNTGIKAAIGEFICFLDDDDLFLPEKLSLEMSRLEDDSETGLVYGLYYSATGMTSNVPKVIKGMYDRPMELRPLLLGYWPHISTVLVRRLWVEHIGGFDEQLRVGDDDVDFYLKLALSGCRMVCLPQPLAIVRQQPGSIGKSVHRSEVASFDVLNKAFNDPRLPPELLDLRNLSYATQLIRLAASAYATSQPEMGRKFLQRALKMEPSLASEHIDDLVNLLVYRIRGLTLENPEEVLTQVTKDLPGEITFVRKLVRRLWGRFYEISAFQAYQLDQRAKTLGYVIRAVSNTPSCLRNRGLISIFVRSLIGNRVINEFKGLSSTQRRSEAG